MAFRTWFYANLLGWLLSIVLILVLSGFLDSIGIEGLQFYLGIAVGLGLGGFQYWRLRKIWPIGISWILSMILFLAVPFLITDFWSENENDLYFSLAAGIPLLSFVQYLLIHSFHKAPLAWMLRIVLAWILVAAFLFLTSFFTRLQTLPLLFAFINLILLLSGGPVIAWMTAPLVKDNYLK